MIKNNYLYTEKKDKGKSNNSIHAAHTFCDYKNRKWQQIDYMILIASSVFFKLFNPNSTIDFYGDKNSASLIKKNVGPLNIYNNIDSNSIESYAKKEQIDHWKFYPFSKFVALNELTKKYENSICILDTDIITLTDFEYLINKYPICCTHLETTEDSTIYPNISNINHPKDYQFSSDSINFKGHACNTSILGIRDRKIIDEYIFEVFRFMRKNNKANLNDILWIEQRMLSVIANRNKAKIHTIVNSVYKPTNFKFQNKKWRFYNILNLLNRKNGFKTFHSWTRKDLFIFSKKYSKFSCLLLLNLIKKEISPEQANKILQLPCLSSLKKPFYKYPYSVIKIFYIVFFNIAILKGIRHHKMISTKIKKILNGKHNN